jgi:hypothetical protein
MVNEKTQKKARYGAQKKENKSMIWCMKNCRKKNDLVDEEINKPCPGCCCMRKSKKTRTSGAKNGAINCVFPFKIAPKQNTRFEAPFGARA